MQPATYALAAAISCATLAGSPAFAGEIAEEPATWTPVPGKLMTEWGAKVTPENVWPEYPRPSLERSEWLNLNGLWDYAILGKDSAAPDKPQGKILVPFPPESALSGVGKILQPDQTIHYRRTFEVPASWKGRRIILNFGAVDWRCAVRVNGKEVGSHSGGYTPFSFDITDALKDGPNEIVVIAHDPTDTGGQGRGKQWLNPHGIWYTPTSGIWQTVWLEPVNDVHITRLGFDADPATGAIDVIPEHAGQFTPDMIAQVFIEKQGEPLAILECEGGMSPHAQIVLPHPRPWTPDDPFLYDVVVRITQGDKVIDEVKSYLAYRTVALGKDENGVPRLLLNGEPVFHFGPLDQGFWPDGLYTPPSDEAMRFDIEAAKRMGSNMLRKHVKVESDRYYTWCDRLGILVWQDMPSPFFSDDPAGSDKNKFSNPPLTQEWKDTFLAEWTEIIDDLRHHPSIVMWVPWNEGWGQNDLDWSREIVERTKKLDPSRLVNNASGWTDMAVGDTIDHHLYPGPGMPPIESTRASVLGEFGGLGLPIDGHTWVQKNNWGYVSYQSKEELTDAYLSMIEKLPMLIGQGLCAAVYTQTTDVEIEVNGWLTYDRKVWKIDPDVARAATLKVYKKPPTIRRILGHAGDGLPGTWRLTTSEPGPDSQGRAWSDTGYDDSGWTSGRAGFGTGTTPGALVETEWNTDTIWMRSTFDAPAETVKRLAIGSNLALSIHHDENASVYLNGTLIAEFQGYTTGYITIQLPESAAQALKPGTNTLAVRCTQTRGGQYIDCGLVEVVSGE
jgi:hypothetical protein